MDYFLGILAAFLTGTATGIWWTRRTFRRMFDRMVAQEVAVYFTEPPE